MTTPGSNALDATISGATGDRSKLIHQPTRGQLRVLVFLAAHLDATGKIPTREAIAEYAGVRHRQQVHAQLRQLEERGLLVRATMRVTDAGREVLGIPKPGDKTKRELTELDLFKNALREWLGLAPLPSEGNRRGWQNRRLNSRRRAPCGPPSTDTQSIGS